MSSFQILPLQWKIVKYLFKNPFSLSLQQLYIMSRHWIIHHKIPFYLNIGNNIKWHYNEKYWFATLMIVIINSIREIWCLFLTESNFTNASRQFQKLVLTLDHCQRPRTWIKHSYITVQNLLHFKGNFLL